MSRTRKREYTGSKEFDRSCRSHGGCPWCEGNRTIKLKRLESYANEELRTAEDEAGPEALPFSEDSREDQGDEACWDEDDRHR